MHWTQPIPRLQGSMVDVREIADGDAGTLLELLTDADVAAYMSAPPPSLSAFRGFIAWAQRERQQGDAVCFAIVPHGLSTAVGIIQLRAQEPSWFTAEWGFAIGKAFWATGAFLDAAELVVAFAFDRIGVRRLEARAMIGNGRGNGALQKLGARPEGTLAQAIRQHGRYHPQFLWGLHVDDWRQRSLFRHSFRAAEAQARIAGAIRETERRLLVRPHREAVGSPALFPFFITEK